MNKIKIVNDELIGLNIKIIDTTDPTWLNVSGLVIDESKNTLLIRSQGRDKRIAKNIAVFEFNRQGEKTIVEGLRLMYRPEDRIKKAR
ncbi:MAG: ribonuclease P protein subunit [Candidatus Thermoplasmatota archaeon]